MSAIWKNSVGPVIVHDEARWESETLSYWINRTYQGRQDAIAGLEVGLQTAGIDYDITNEGPVYQLTTRIPIVSPDTASVDRFEISTESSEVEIWTLPAVFEEAQRLANALVAGERGYQKLAEDFVEDGTPHNLTFAAYPLFFEVVKHLRGGVKTFPVDFIVMRRFRRIDREFSIGATGRMNTDNGNFLYSTAQLNLPSDVAFVLPVSPATNALWDASFRWSWRKRGQRVEFVDQWVEQTVEVLFAPHSLLVNQIATGNLIW